MLIRDVMTDSVVTAEADSSVREVAELMRERNVGSVVLVAGDALTGIVTDRDLAVSVLADDRAGADRAADHASAPVVTANSSAGRASNEQEGGAPEQFAPMKPQGRPPAKAPYLRSVNIARQ